jgi:Zn-dependent protease with chaperone function
MKLVAALALGVVVLGWGWPRLMLRLQVRVAPRAALVIWPFAQLSFAAMVAATACVLIFPGSVVDALSVVLRVCSNTLRSHPGLSAAAGFGVVSAIAFAATSAAWWARRAVLARRGERERFATALQLAGAERPGHPGVWWFPSARPTAFCVGGIGPGIIGASTGLLECLDGRGVAAVIAHERAHARQRHHLTTLLATTLARVLPFVPLFACGSAAARTLAEEAADAESARAHGAEVVASALIAVNAAAGHAAAPSDRRILGLTTDDLSHRLDRLAATSRRSASAVLAAAVLALPAAGATTIYLMAC